MTRTPLLRRLQRLYQDFHEQELTGKPVAEIRAAREQQHPSRREFLKIAAAGTVGAALWPGRTFGTSPLRIAIVGGGISGLNAALTLQDAGYPCTVYEAAARIGGRIHSDTTSWRNGQVSERGGELIDSSHKTILKLAKRFKIGIADVLGAEPAGSSDTFRFFGRYYPGSQAIDDFAPVFAAVRADLKRAGYPTVYNSYTGGGYVLDHLSVFDWIESRVPGGHSSAMGQLLDVAYNIEYGAETTDQSALNLIYLLAYQPSASGFALFGRSDEHYHLDGGNERLPKAIASALAPNSIRFNTSLKSIALNPDATYRLTFRDKSSTFAVDADRVILAIPFSVLRTIDYSGADFGSLKQAAIEQLGYGTNAKLHLQFKGRLWNQPGPWGVSNGGSYADTGYQVTWDVTRAQAGATGILVNYTGGDVAAALAGQKAIKAADGFLNQAATVFPGLAATWNGRATLDTPATSPLFRGSYSYWRVGQYTLFSGVEKEPAGHCYFAGEHCSQDFQGFMEGAAQEGIRAAAEIIKSV